MKKVCLNLHIHQPFRLKRYRFFDIGNDHYYFDDFQNEEVFRSLVNESYLPTLKTIRQMVVMDNLPIKVSLAITGTAFEQIEMYAPEILDILLDLNKRGVIEFLCTPYAYSLSSLGDKEEFKKEIEYTQKKIKLIFGKAPSIFRNTELIYSDDIAHTLSEIGFKATIMEGAKHVLGWKSPNYIYESAASPKLKLIVRNSGFSNDLARNFSLHDWSEYPLTSEKFASWIAALPEADEIVYLDIPIEAFGHIHKRHTGIFEFLQALPNSFADRHIAFALPSELVETSPSAGLISVNSPISWSQEEKGVTTWLGNVLQKEAFETMLHWSERARLCTDRRLRQDWLHLQSCDHYFYMTTLYEDVRPFSPYETPYDAFNNYMNVVADLIMRIKAQYPTDIENEELNALLITIKNQDKQIAKLETELKKLKQASSASKAKKKGKK